MGDSYKDWCENVRDQPKKEPRVIDWTKPVEFINPNHGKVDRVLCTDAPGDFPIIILNGECVERFRADGARSSIGAQILRNVPKARTFWMLPETDKLVPVVYKQEHQEQAMGQAKHDGIPHILKITWDGTKMPPIVEVVEVQG